MECVGCGFILQAEFAFCPKCGTRQPARCVGCGYVCPPDFAFCPRCGQHQSATPQRTETPPPPASPEMVRPAPPPSHGMPTQTGDTDRRTITVLFADLSG